MLANAILRLTKIDHTIKAGYMKDVDVKKLDAAVSKIHSSGLPVWLFNRRKDYETGEDAHLLTVDLKFQKENDVKRLQKVKSYRGFRHASKLPSRGQRTRANFRGRGGKRSLGVKRKK